MDLWMHVNATCIKHRASAVWLIKGRLIDWLIKGIYHKEYTLSAVSFTKKIIYVVLRVLILFYWGIVGVIPARLPPSIIIIITFKILGIQTRGLIHQQRQDKQ